MDFDIFLSMGNIFWLKFDFFPFPFSFSPFFFPIHSFFFPSIFTPPFPFKFWFIFPELISFLFLPLCFLAPGESKVGKLVGSSVGNFEAAATTWTADEIRAAPNDGGAAVTRQSVKIIKQFELRKFSFSILSQFFKREIYDIWHLLIEPFKRVLVLQLIIWKMYKKTWRRLSNQKVKPELIKKTVILHELHVSYNICIIL